eukprot:scaffold3416_cov133-Isochrysis_galbana.AAC.7
MFYSHTLKYGYKCQGLGNGKHHTVILGQQASRARARATNEGPRARGRSWDSNPGHDDISVASAPLHHDG